MIATGIEGIDQALPQGGLPTGSVIEVLSAGSGTGARALAFRVAVRAAGLDPDHDGAPALRDDENTPGGRIGMTSAPAPWDPKSKPDSAILLAPPRWVVVVDCEGDFYPPAAVALGMPPDRLVVVRTRKSKDAFWATDQALRCNAVAAVIATRLVLDPPASRRLQLAAEASGGVGFILAPSPDRAPDPAGDPTPMQRPVSRGPTFAAVRLLVEPVGVPSPHPSPALERPVDRTPSTGGAFAAARRFRITFLKMREGKPVEPVIVGWSDASFDVPLRSVPALRAAANRRRHSA